MTEFSKSLIVHIKPMSFQATPPQSKHRGKTRRGAICTTATKISRSISRTATPLCAPNSSSSSCGITQISTASFSSPASPTTSKRAEARHDFDRVRAELRRVSRCKRGQRRKRLLRHGHGCARRVCLSTLEAILKHPKARSAQQKDRGSLWL